MQTTIIINGTHCQSCKRLIEDVCADLGTQCTVDFQTGKTVVEHDTLFDLQRLKSEVESLGDYAVILHDEAYG